METRRRWMHLIAHGGFALRVVGVVGWGVCFALLWSGPLSRAEEPYFGWDAVVSGIWHGWGLAALGSAIFVIPSMFVVLGVHEAARWRDRRRGRTPRDAGPPTVFLVSSWLYVPVLMPIAFASCVSHGLDEMLDAPWRLPARSPVPTWATMMNSWALAHPATQTLLGTLCLVFSFVLATKSPILASIVESTACPTCGYSREGLTKVVCCPECGAVPPCAGRVPTRPTWISRIVRWQVIGVLALVAAVFVSVEVGLGERSAWVYRFVFGGRYWFERHPLEPALMLLLFVLGMFGLVWPVRGVRVPLLLLTKLHALSFLCVVILAALAHFVFAAGAGNMRFHRSQFEFIEVCVWLTMWTAATSLWFVHGLRRWKEDLDVIVRTDALRGE